MATIVTQKEAHKHIEIFCCYARKDQELFQELKNHLMPLKWEGLITLWADTDINAGEEWEKEVHLHLNTSHIILLLVSPDFMASNYCYSIEMTRAMERHKRGEAQVLPIILRPADWQNAPFAKLQALPKDGRPIISSEWSYRDEGFTNAAKGIRKAVEALLSREGLPRLAPQTHVAGEPKRARIFSRRVVIRIIGGIGGIGGAGLFAVHSGLARFLFSRTTPPVLSSPITHTSPTTSSPSIAWYKDAYVYRKTIVIDHTKVSGNTNLSNFPVLITLTGDADLKAVTQGGKVQNSQGYDILFTDSTGRIKLDHEIENYHPSTGEIEMWVRIPTLSASTNTVIYMYFGNEEISSSQEKRSGVWDTNYQGIYHLSDNEVNTVVKDSTSKNNNGINTANTNTKSVSGKFGNGLTYNGSSDATNLKNPAGLQITGQITLEVWVNVASFPSLDDLSYKLSYIIGKGYDNIHEGYFLRLRTLAVNDGEEIYLEAGAYDNTNTDYMAILRISGWSTNSWHHIVGLYDGSEWQLHFDGIQRNKSTGTLPGALSSTSDVYIGATFIQTSLTRYFNGIIDEVRISNIGRSSNWIVTEYNNQSSPSTFYNVSASTSRR